MPTTTYPVVRRIPPVLLALLLILSVTGALWPRAPKLTLEQFDQTFYLGSAYDLRHTGVFTDGFGFSDTGPGAPRPPGMHFTPFYATLLSIAARLDPAFDRAVDCVVEGKGHDPACPNTAPLMRSLQFAMLAGVYLMIWWVAGVISGRVRVRWIALTLALLTAPDLLKYVNLMMTDITALTLPTLATAAAVRGLTGRRAAFWFACAGICAGAAGLNRPIFCYVFLICAAVGLIWTWRRPPSRIAAIGFLLAGLAVILPWVARNAIELGRLDLTYGYAPYVFAERVSFDAMDWGGFGRSLVCYLPDGNGMGDLLFEPHACARFQWTDRPDNYFAYGHGPLLEHALAASGGYDHAMAYLLRTYVYPDPLKHAAVTLSLSLRGAWINRYWGLFLMPFAAAFTWRALRDRDPVRLAITLPAWLVLVMNSAVAVTQTRYSFMLILPYATAGAIAAEAAWTRWRATRGIRAFPA